MLDGAALLTSFVRGLHGSGQWTGGRGENLFDSGCHHYEVYETADAEWVSIGPVERPFYDRLLFLLGLDGDEDLRDHRTDRQRWPEYKARFAAVFRTRTRDEWTAYFEHEPDVCYAPVLSFDEAPHHPHNVARGVFVRVGDAVQPAPAPRFSRSVPDQPSPPPTRGSDTDAVLREVGFRGDEIAELRASGVVA